MKVLDDSDNEEASFAQKILKKRKKTSELSCKWVPPLSNICERSRLFPVHLEGLVFLKLNPQYWDVKVVSALKIQSFWLIFFFNNWSAKSVIAIIDLRHAPIKIIYCVASNNINHLYLRPIILQYNISHPWWFLCWERREVPVRSSLFACSAVNE